MLDRLVNDDGTVQKPSDPGCTISFGTDDILILYGDEALQAWAFIKQEAADIKELVEI